MGEHFKNSEEDGNTSAVFDFSMTTERMKVFIGWMRNLKEMSDEERKLMIIFLIKNKQKDPTEYYVTLNEQNQLVATDGKNSLMLEGKKWEVPAVTLETLNKPKK